MNHESILITKLQNAGERVSSARVAIFRGLARKGPITIPRLVETMASSAIDPATTYRTIKLFRALDIIRDIIAGGKRLIELSDDYDTHHHHFWCRNCGTLIDFDDNEIEASLKRAAERMQAVISSHQLEISGYCANCVDSQRG